MKLLLVILCVFCLPLRLNAHVAGVGSVAVRTWHLRDGQILQASLLSYRADTVILEADATQMTHFAIKELSPEDQTYVLDRYQHIRALNSVPTGIISSDCVGTTSVLLETKLLAAERLLYGVLSVLFVSLCLSLMYVPHRYHRLVWMFAVASCAASLFGFRERRALVYSQTSPAFIDSVFSAFKPDVRTSWNAQYFLVESIGLPKHPMMAGITGWQQQVPLPQCYVGSNAWSIPLNPEIATTPIPVNADHFSRGAIAVAANGIAIFNPYTNTGVDALVDGQLDQWGGHCGRADDYHYHVAPLHLYLMQAKTLPIAFGLDGYAVYGESEPDGSAMRSLDANHGHYGDNGVYHYHGTVAKPYMIATMVGKVTEDSTRQIIPQAAARPVRPSLTPLKGAVITDCIANGTNGYVLSYTLNGQTYKVSYTWTTTGTYTFDFINPDGSKTTSTYKGPTPCLSVSGVADNRDVEVDVKIFPNPARTRCSIHLSTGIDPSSVREVALYNQNGIKVYTADRFAPSIDLNGVPKGLYLYCLSTLRNTYVKKIVID